MRKKRTWLYATLVCLVMLLAFSIEAVIAQNPSLSPNEQLGKSIFFDKNLSIKKNQACAVCHTFEVGWTGPEEFLNAHGSVYEGSISTSIYKPPSAKNRFGNRKPPSSAYATFSPVLQRARMRNQNTFMGGNFWDGRATGEKLGNPAADQAQGPFLNLVEQALPDSACVVYRVLEAKYPVSFQQVWGNLEISWPRDVNKVCSQENAQVVLSDGDREKVETAYNNIALSIAAFEGSKESSQFTSKYDYFLAGKANLTQEERRGLNLFRGSAKCANCHTLKPGAKREPALFTDFTYDNLGVPRNPENPWYNMPSEFNPDGWNWIDEGLGGYLATRDDYKRFAQENLGKQKVPTLRNVDKRPKPEFVKAYMHNGYFKSLEQVVHFYNTRDVKPKCLDPFTTAADAIAQGCWPVPEVSENLNMNEVGDLRLSNEEEKAIVAFMKTLSDGYKP
jgi:cytochrome c peroxidase